MIYVVQTQFGPRGNCFAACAASILEIPLARVPNFVPEHGPDWYEEFCNWLQPMNLSAIFIESDSTLPPPRGYAIATLNDVEHAVVVRSMRLEWDPSPVNHRFKIGHRLMPKNVRYWTTFTVLDPSKPLEVWRT